MGFKVCQLKISYAVEFKCSSNLAVLGLKLCKLVTATPDFCRMIPISSPKQCVV